MPVPPRYKFTFYRALYKHVGLFSFMHCFIDIYVMLQHNKSCYFACCFSLYDKIIKSIVINIRFYLTDKFEYLLVCTFYLLTGY